MEIRFSLSIHGENGEKFFGEGPYRLLKGIARLGSLRSAAQEMNMAYTKAFRILKNAEEQLGFPLTSRKIGGRQGGGSVLTPEAEDLLARYEALKTDCSRELQRLYTLHFAHFGQEETHG